MMLWRRMTENKILNFLVWVWKSVKICFIPNPEVGYIEILRYQLIHPHHTARQGNVKDPILYQLWHHKGYISNWFFWAHTIL